MTHGSASIARGVQIAEPVIIERDVTIEERVKIGRDCSVKRNALISSGSSIERSAIMERVYVGRNCTISDSVIGETVVVHDNASVSGSIIGPGCVIGDRATVLSGSRIWPSVSILSDEVVSGIIASPLETAFYCFTNFGHYTGILATSVEGFIEALERSPIDSIEFHAKRRDYEKWIRDVLGLNELADGIEEIRRMGLTGEDLRGELIEVTRKWADAIESKSSNHSNAGFTIVRPSSLA